MRGMSPYKCLAGVTDIANRQFCLQVVAIDMRGYGESDKPKDRRAYDLSELTSDVSEVIKALGHKE